MPWAHAGRCAKNLPEFALFSLDKSSVSKGFSYTLQESGHVGCCDKQPHPRGMCYTRMQSAGRPVMLLSSMLAPQSCGRLQKWTWFFPTCPLAAGHYSPPLESGLALGRTLATEFGVICYSVKADWCSCYGGWGRVPRSWRGVYGQGAAYTASQDPVLRPHHHGKGSWECSFVLSLGLLNYSLVATTPIL